MTPRGRLLDVFRGAVAGCHGAALVRASLRARPLGAGRIHVLGAGKAAAAMGQGLELELGDRIVRGRLTTKDGHAVSLQSLELAEAAHPVPDARSEAQGRE